MRVNAARSIVLIIISFGVVGLSAISMYAVWSFTASLPHILRGVISLFAWIASFAFGSFVFWTVTNHMAVQKKA